MNLEILSRVQCLGLALPFSLEAVRGLVLLAIGFGFVVFWHELGHFLAAKWAGVKVEQFAVGFGNAMVAWRKGLGITFGTSAPQFKQRIKDHLTAKGAATFSEDEEPSELQIAQGAKELGISETEYRLNWIPLGGYVKMLGQDDLKANAEASDPRAFNRQTIGKRMVIVSAGVIMNVFLAAIGFMVLFRIGFHVPPALVGGVVPNSPAQKGSDGGLQVGDKILSIAGKDATDDWTKINLNIALTSPDEPIPVVVERTIDGQKQTRTIMVTPRHGGGAMKEILSIGIDQAYDLRRPTFKEMGPGSQEEYEKQKPDFPKLLSPDQYALNPGDTIVAVNGQPIGVSDFVAFTRAVQASDGRPLDLTVRSADGAQRKVTVATHFREPYGDQPLNFAGMVPRVQIRSVAPSSSAYGWVLPGDIVTSMSRGPQQRTIAHPTFDQFRTELNDAGQAKQLVQLDLLRGNFELIALNLRTIAISQDREGLGVGPGYDEEHAVVAGTLDDSSAAASKIPGGATLTQVGEQPVTTWFDVRRQMLAWAEKHPSGAEAPVPIAFRTPDGETGKASLAMSAQDLDSLRSDRFGTELAFDQPRSAVRKAPNSLVAAKWGVAETRDFILQFYLTIRRMVTGGVPAKQAMGPIGIFQAGTSFAERGNDWLIWFLAMISANLAVVNFLPIPIVDGGLFTFLILEKIKGKPLSPKVQAIAQYVGLALLVGVFLFVTYQDLMNFKFRGH